MASTTLTPPPQETMVRRKERCDRCRYWSIASTAAENAALRRYSEEVPLARGERGICHRYPPPHRSLFPVTLATDWCGEYRD